MFAFYERARVAAHVCKPIQQEDRAAPESKGGSFIAAALGDFHPMRLHASACSGRAAHPLFAHAPAPPLPLLLKQLGQVD